MQEPSQLDVDWTQWAALTAVLTLLGAILRWALKPVVTVCRSLVGVAIRAELSKEIAAIATTVQAAGRLSDSVERLADAVENLEQLAERVATIEGMLMIERPERPHRFPPTTQE